MLTIQQGIQILNQIPSKSYTVLCEQYGVGKSMISDIKKQEPEFRAYKQKMTEIGIGWSAKFMKLGRDEELDAVLFLCLSKSKKREYRLLDRLDR